MKPKLRRWLSVPLSVAMLFCMMPTTAMTITAADEQPMLIGDENPIVTYAQPDVQEGVILHCFDWSFDNIKANMADIAAAGYTAIQTSPIQRCKQATYGDTNEVWWAYYQPGSFYIENVQNRSALGDKDDFIAMCEVAHQYGIKVIVDVVANHLGNDGDYTKSAAILPDYLLEDQYWHDNWNVKANHNIREQSINYSLGGLPDLNTENATIQQLVLDYLKECIDAGADGFRFDAAKHIGVDADGSQYTFWKNTIPAAKDYYLSTNNRTDSFKAGRLYCYGEILDNTQTASYTKYLDALTDTVGNGVRGYVAGHNAGGAGSNNYYNPSLQTTQKVLWAESHDTYSNEEKESTYVSESDINKTWALVSAREGATALYFARTDDYRGGYIGEVYSTQWDAPEVVAANKFHNIFYGQSEYLSDSGDIAYNERGSKGVVLVNVNGTTANVSVTAHKMADGTYTDQVSGNTFTVSNGTISGTIGSTGIAVVYNDDDTVEDTFTVSKLYLVPGKWDKDGATFKACLYNNNTKVSQEIAMTVTEDSTVYKADVPTNTEWTKVKFQRIGVDGTTVWNYTNDYFLENGNNRYSVTSTEDWNGNIGLWDTYTTCEHTYGTPTWTWNGTSSATATFTCTQNCGVSRSVNAAISSTPGDTTVTYTATVTFNGQTYTNTKTVDKTDDITLYFDLSNKTGWLNDSAEFAMYVWNSSNSTWFDLTLVEGSTALYSGDIPADTWENVIFCRMNPARDTNRWGNGSDTDATKPVWGQTVDLAIPANGNNCFVMNADKITSGSDNGKYSGTWNTYTPVVHTHTYGAPTWSWADDNSTATATFTCTGCDETAAVTDNAPAAQYVGGTAIYTAAITGPDNGNYQTTAMAPMIERLETQYSYNDHPEEAVAFQHQYADMLYDVYTQIKAHTAQIDIRSYGVPYEGNNWVYLSNTLNKCYPDISYLYNALLIGRSSTDGTNYTIAYVKPEYADSNTALSSAKMMENFYSKAQWYLDQIDPSWDDFTKALMLHDLLVMNNFYRIQIGEYGDEDYVYSSNYTFMVDGWGRCDNYTQVYAYLLAQLGIKSEIVTSNEMSHAWLMVCLDGKYYHVDVTWDDPLVYGTDRPNKVPHTYFLLSGDTISSSDYSADTHYDFTTYHLSSDDYDDYSVLHTIQNPIFAVNGKFYTLLYLNETVRGTIYTRGVVVAYNTAADLATDTNGTEVYKITDVWSAGGSSYWTSNYSSLAYYNGLLYFNGEHTVNSIDPATNTVTMVYEDTSRQYYGMYIDADGMFYGMVATSPNEQPQAIALNQPPEYYTVTWENWDGTVLETDTDVEAGTMPRYNGATPTKTATAQYTYSFNGWTPAVAAVTGDVTYTATFTENTREYTITWMLDANTPIDTTTVAYGTTPTHADAVKDADAQYTYTFNGWTPSITAVTGEATYTAQFTATPIQTETIYYLVGTMNGWAENPDYVFVRNEGCTTAEEYMLTNVELAANAEFKVKSSKNDWFPGGSTLNDTVTAAGTYTIYFRPNWDGTDSWYYGAIYAQNVTPCTVTFAPANNDAVTTQTVTYGNTATAPKTAPTKYGYDFVGWYNGDEAYDFDTLVTSDLTLTAHWQETQVSITYTDINGFDTVTRVGMVSFSTATYTLPATPYLDGYDFDGWTVNSASYKNKDDAVAQISYLVKNGSPVAVKVVYNKQSATYKLIVENGTIKDTDGATESWYQASEQIYVVANDDSEGSIFSCWKASYGGNDEVVVGYERTYVFRMPTKGMTLTACYVSQAQDVADKCGTGYIETVKKLADNKMSFVSILSVPNGCQMLKAGIVVQKASELNGAELTTENAKATRFSDTSNNHYSLFKYTWTLTTSNTTTEWSVRPYLEYRDQNGVVQTVYGDTVTASLSSIS